MNTATISMAATLEQLVAPMPLEKFMTEYWGKRPLVIHAGLDRIRELAGGDFSSEDFKANLRQLEKAFGADDFASASRTAGRFVDTDPDRVPTVVVRAAQVNSVYDCGFTVIGQAAHKGLYRLAMSLKKELNFAGEAFVFGSLSPGGEAVYAHFDSVESFKIQMEGRKCWRIGSRPALEWPRQTSRVRQDGSTFPRAAIHTYDWENDVRVDPADLTEVILEAGDILYLPNGVVHATEAMGPSFSVDIGFRPASPLSILLSIAERALTSDVNWRHVPIAPEFDGVKTPPAMRNFFANRLDEIAALMDGLSPDSLDLSAAYQESIASIGERCEHANWRTWWRPDAHPIEPNDRVRLATYAPMTCAHGMNADGEFEMRLFQGDAKLVVTGAGAEFLRQIIDHRDFVAREATSWGSEPYPWEVVREYLEMLRDQGVIEHELRANPRV